MTESPAPGPRTQWEFCLSAADELTRLQAPPDPEQHRQVIVLLAAVIAAGADGAGLTGARVADLPMDGTGGALDMLGVAGRLSVRAFPAPPGLGGEERTELLAADQEAFTAVRALAEDVLRQHLAQAPPTPVPTVGTCVRAADRARRLRDVAQALAVGDED
ncbi:hypothetical protein [Kitasatospora purpeofusca]|uniref:hypothetical protein n=1 Tax=Kitasatospora purpeofusca TaxID=67352 RepID=UPI0037F21731